MGKNKTHIEFVNNIKRLYPNLKVIDKYTDSRVYLTVEDEKGIKYRAKPTSLIAGHYPDIRTAIDKTNAFKIKLAEIQPKIKVKGEYINNRKKILIEDEYGIEYLSSPDMLSGGHPPVIKTAKDKTKAFITMAILIHGSKYDYSQAEYERSDTKIKIKCLVHGDFMQTPSVHINNHCGCPKCGYERTGESNKYNFFSRTGWVKYCMEKKRKPYLYIIKCYDEDEEFIKIGMTTTKLYRRLCSANLPYKYKVIGKITGEPEFVFDMEKMLHKKYSNYKYKPLKKFAGGMECFNMGVLDVIYWKQSEIWN